MISETYVILGMGVCAFIPRVLPIIVPGNVNAPPELYEFLGFMPPAILAAIVTPGLFFHDPTSIMALSASFRYLLAGAVSLSIGFLFKKPLIACAIASIIFFIWPHIAWTIW